MTSKVSFIRGEIDVHDDKAWEDYVSRANEMGWDRLKDIEQAAWDRMSKN